MKYAMILVATNLITAVVTTSLDADTQRPNVILILADDLGWKDVGFNGGVIRTPHIDRIANEGVKLNRFYVAPVCTPTRAGLMTGRYPIRFGLMRGVVMGYHGFGLDPAETIIPQVMAAGGYAHRGIFGKWHLGHSKLAYHPLRRGFTEFAGHLNAAIDYFTHQWLGEVDWWRGFEQSDEQGYATDLITQHAVKFLKDHGDGDSPFFMYVPYNAPHAPFQAKQEDLSMYADIESVPVESVIGAGYGPEKYDWIGGHATGRAKLENAAKRHNDRRITGAMINSLDVGVGQILDTLDQLGVSENTLVWFLSDNGGDSGIGDNRPYRGAKGSVFEGGIRVAAAARWPGGGVGGGRVVESALNYTDVMPTLMNIAGVSDNFELQFDGMDVMSTLQGQAKTGSREYFSFCGQLSDEREHVTVMDGDWKVVIIGPPLHQAGSLEKSQVMLFNLATDIGETNDLSGQRKDITARLVQRAIEYRELQPEKHVPLLRTGRDGFQAPKHWALPTE